MSPPDPTPLDLAVAEGRRFIDSLAQRSVGPTGSRADILAPLPASDVLR